MSTFANVYVGNAPNDGTGTPLRNAFQIIDQNFANISTTSIGSPVSSVAGRTGNIILSVNDIAGVAATSYVNSLVSAANTAAHLYTMGNSQNWTTSVTTIGTALDELAARLKAAGF